MEKTARLCRMIVLLATGLIIPMGDSAPAMAQSVSIPSGPTDAYGDPLPDRAVARFGAGRMRHVGIVNAVAFLPDGKSLFSSGSDGSLRRWDAATGKELQRIRCDGYYSRFALSSDGAIVAVVDHHIIRLVDANTGETVRQLMGHKDLILSIAISVDGKSVASCSNDATVRVWSVEKGTELYSIPFGKTRALSLDFSPDGAILAGGGEDKTLHLWEASSGKEQRVIRTPGTVSRITFSPDGKTLAYDAGSGMRIQTIVLIDPQTGAEKRKLTWTSAWGSDDVDFSPDGTMIATSCFDGSVRIWETETGKSVDVMTLPAGTNPRWRGRNPVGPIDFAPDGKSVALGAYDGRIRLYDLSTKRDRLSFPGHDEPPTFVTFSRDGKTVASASEFENVRLWNSSTGKEIVMLPRQGRINRIALTPDGRRVAVADNGRFVRVWDAASGKELHRIPLPGNPPHSLDFSSDGRRLAATSQESFLLWDATDGDEILTVEGNFDDVVFSPDGKQALAVSYEVISIRDAENGRERATIRTAEGNRAIFSPDGKTILLAGKETPSEMYDLASGKKLHSLPLEKDRPLTFLSDGAIILASGDQGRISFWNVSTGERAATLEILPRDISSIALSFDGNMLAAGQSDGTVILWDFRSLILDKLWEEVVAAKTPDAVSPLWTTPEIRERTVPFLRQRLLPTPKNPGRIQTLMTNLGSSDEKILEPAALELENLGDEAEPLLRKAAEQSPSPDIRKQASSILGGLECQIRVQRRIRGIDLLQRIGSAEARKLLEELEKAALTPKEREAAGSALKLFSEKRR